MSRMGPRFVMARQTPKLNQSVREAARWAVYWLQSRADGAAHLAVLVGLRPRMSARMDEGISEASYGDPELPTRAYPRPNASSTCHACSPEFIK